MISDFKRFAHTRPEGVLIHYTKDTLATSLPLPRLPPGPASLPSFAQYVFVPTIRTPIHASCRHARLVGGGGKAGGSPARRLVAARRMVAARPVAVRLVAARPVAARQR